MIKVVNQRDGGSLFHYAHFICDCLLPEIVNDVHKYKKIYRIKNLNQTIGNFRKIYNEVTNTQNIELPKDKINSLKLKTKIINNKKKINNIKDFNKFRNVIFNKYNIENIQNNYPKILLMIKI